MENPDSGTPASPGLRPGSAPPGASDPPGLRPGSVTPGASDPPGLRPGSATPGSRRGRMLAESAAVEEVAVWLEVNGEPAVTWMCTPDLLE